MKSGVKFIIIGAAIAIIGVIITVCAIVFGGNSMKKMDFTVNEFTQTQECNQIKLDWGASNVKMEFYEGDKIFVSYPQSKAFNVTVSEKAGTLKLSAKTKFLFISFGKMNIPDTIVKLPAGAVYSLDIDMGAGKMTIPSGEYNNVTIDMGAGILECGALNIHGKLDCELGAGSATFESFTCTNADLEVHAGEIKVKSATANSINCDLSAGTVKFDSLTSDSTVIDASAGTVIATFTAEQKEYNIKLDKSAGTCNVYPQVGTTQKKIDIDMSAGTVKLQFAN